ncbi:forkhead domain-containing protein [Hirsutella rhossiliensis]|uniref:Forkhead domain-containing protein n=1 Tax=Hirsutella rhossiliensis TaxID=111463 RepID=A0A9P8N7Q6_9HYPO|nr:forkhead domain-containing protein [Hirsutella rhossiliensis]KAH0967511.1 forkhead domain-containing protein [Hirsutella rhossiliensis]
MTSSSDGRNGPEQAQQQQRQQQQQHRQQAHLDDHDDAAGAAAKQASPAAAPASASASATVPAETSASGSALEPAIATNSSAPAASTAAAASAPQEPAPNAAPPAQPSTPPPSTHLSLSTNNAAADVPMTDAPAMLPAYSTAPEPDQLTPSTPFATNPMTNLDQHAYMMMALASMSAAPSAMSPPPTVTPSQVTLPNLADGSLNGLGVATSLRQAAAGKGLESFARIEFADSVFQMTTYAVIIGRDQRALQQARRDEKRADEHQRRVEENASKGLPPPSPIQNDRSKFSKSYVSEEGGMLGPESDGEENGRPAKRRKTSTTGSSQKDNDESQENMISNRQYVSHTPGAAAVDLTSLRPSPYHIPFIGIHSPGPRMASKTKAISREHLRITYNQQDGVFEAIPLHKNGFFCEDVHYKSDKVVLKCGDRLQIKDIDFRFIINGVERGRTGAEEFLEEEATKKRQSHGGKEMSFDFEQSHGAGEIQDTSDELSDLEVSPPELSDFGDDVDGGDAEEAEPDAEEEAEGDIPKKRGPGRPPKNGIMSKREQRLLKKQQQEMAKKTVPQAPPVEPPVKRKVGRPRKHPLPENAEDRPEKRKYKPRKPKNEDGAEGSDAERRAREKKEKKTRPKSPPLELKIDDYSEEQLQKPNKNYGVLIDETLTAAGPDGLTLKQIYKRICQRYPWFYFHTETKGWESSVRHNLIGNEAFKKDETTNLWSRVPGVELDAGKKRKAPSPDRVLAAQGYGPYSYPYNAAQHMHLPGTPGYLPGHSPPAGYQPHGSSASPTGQVGQPAAPRPPALPHVPVPPPVIPPSVAAPARPSPATALAPAGAKTTPGPAQASPPTAAPAARPSATPPASAPPKPVVDPRLLSAVVSLKNGLVENLKKARNPKAEAIVMSALNRCIGLKKEATENDKMEAICIKGICQVIDGFTKNKSPTPGGFTASDAAPLIFEPRVLVSLNGFKDVSIRALKARLGEAKAEAVALSAVDRVLGLANASIVPPPGEGEQGGNFEGVEQHLIKSIRQLLVGMNQKLQDPKP